ncbi:PIN domain-containing protein [Thiorhodococcus mannitoliphagus]|uniref:PIN domain-containing protein n=1 Tax=Thiorhodococcus mannitoliphagus TaxID=329406 RepID=A0A6P1E471_9GAMM|nr:PIN domain-containing protein [Thiorhodococcus mannitoliphagus]NEX23332.1 PIN domain-containing protein [Thiorhodococcus mannitoliphagus]
MFLDANILFSAAYRDGSPALLLFELAAADRCNVLTSAFAWDEAHRNIALKCPQRTAILDALRGQLDYAPVPDASAIANAVKQGLPDKDAPILAAARVAEVDILVTGDRTHFGHLYGKAVGGVQVLTLKDTLAHVLEDQ